MTDRDTRDALMIVISNALLDERALHVGDFTYQQRDDFARDIADLIIAAGLVVPSGLTAERLRDASEDLLDCAEKHVFGLQRAPLFKLSGELREWADALSTQTYGGGRGDD